MQAVPALVKGYQDSDAYNAQADNETASATTARQQGGVREDMVRRHNAKRLGEQRAVMAQSGFDPSGNSAVRLQAESAGNAELDALTSRYEAELQAVGHLNQAAVNRRSAKSARLTGYMTAAGELAKEAAKYGTKGGA
jgi:hypothetical protein